MSAPDGKEWLAYYERFPYFSTDTVRDGCHPRLFEHEAATGKAVVLCHGLTDSPHFLMAIARHFHTNLGCDVYLPLLHGHGLKDPKGMEGVELEEWKANIGFSVDTAAGRAEFVSVGGLSTGGTLSFYAACTNPKATGGLYLFSAALDLAGGPMGLIGEIKERILRTFLADLLDSQKPLIGRNPYRYARMDMDGARELARLIKETDGLLKGFDAKTPFPKRVFAAHSENDKTADMRGAACPGPILEAHRVLLGMQPGEVLALLSNCPGSPSDVAAWTDNASVTLLDSFETAPGDYEFYLRRL